MRIYIYVLKSFITTDFRLSQWLILILILLLCCYLEQMWEMLFTFQSNMLPLSSGSECIESGFLCTCSTVLITKQWRGRGDRVGTAATSGPVDQESCAAWNFLHTPRPLKGPSAQLSQSPVPTGPDEESIPTPPPLSLNDFQRKNAAYTQKLTSLHISTWKMETSFTSRTSQKSLTSTTYNNTGRELASSSITIISKTYLF